MHTTVLLNVVIARHEIGHDTHLLGNRCLPGQAHFRAQQGATGFHNEERGGGEGADMILPHTRKPSSPVKSYLSDGVDVLVVGPQQVVHDNASSLVHLDARSARDLVART